MHLLLVLQNILLHVPIFFRVIVVVYSLLFVKEPNIYETFEIKKCMSFKNKLAFAQVTVIRVDGNFCKFISFSYRLGSDFKPDVEFI